jgi:chitinase
MFTARQPFTTLAALAVALLAACTDEAPRCVPGMSVACACAGSQSGVQSCGADGTYAACRCDPPADASTADAVTRDAVADAPAVDVVTLDAAPTDTIPTPDVIAPTDTAATPDVSAPDAAAGPGGLDAFLTQSQFDAMFPHRADAACSGAYFTYAAFLEAARAYPTFLREGTDTQRRRELAALLANISHETTGGWATAPGGPEAWGLCFREEVGCAATAPPACAYCSPSAAWPCATGARYYGRGPIQLSYNYNYGPAGRAIGVDLLARPDLVATDGAIAFKTALWFWMTAQSPKPSCHDVMTGRWTPAAADLAAGRRPGFGQTINIINGGLECGYALDTPPRAAPANVQDRLRFYTYFTMRLGVPEGDAVDCGSMRHY